MKNYIKMMLLTFKSGNARHLAFGLLLAVITVGFSVTVSASTIDEIRMDVYISPEGAAKITEVWTVSVYQGTEGYKPYGNLGNREIQDFSVSDDSGKVYDRQDNWNTGESFDYKKYKNGISRTSDGVELCWGISEYGERAYTLEYTITNFVTQYSDRQGVYFSLMPKQMEQAPSSVVITITSDYIFDESTAKIWAFGYPNGTINFVDGAIVMDSFGTLYSSDYMTALIKFEDDFFIVSDTSSSHILFDDIYNEAMSGVITPEPDRSYATDKPVEYSPPVTRSAPTGRSSGNLPFRLLAGAFPVLPITAFIFLIIKAAGGAFRASGRLNFGEAGNKLPGIKNVDYSRDIPCEKNPFRAYWVARQYAVCYENLANTGIVGAILLDWVRQGYVTVFKGKKGFFSLKDNNYALDLTKLTKLTSFKARPENELLSMLKDAAGSNGILEAREFEKWCGKNYTMMEDWFSSVISYETAELEKSGMITEASEEIPLIFGKTRTIKHKNVNPSMRNEALSLLGLKKFLLEFSAIAQREIVEVHVWEEYLIFAHLLGIADKVEEQFSRLYPDFARISPLNTEITTIAIRSMAYNGCRAAASARANADGSNVSTGSGGSSSSGGGSSAGGSSSGGGFR